jgi:serine/threonine-protein kinase
LILDFGIARVTQAGHTITRTGAALGTPGYMAPEQAAGSRGVISVATDVHGLGAVLYHAVTGRPPFQGASALDTVLAVLEQEPAPPRLLAPSLERDLEMIVQKCLQKPPELRYASASALADDLERFLAGEPVAARAGLFRQVLAGLFRETHHAVVLESWGTLWMWHGLVVLGLCLSTFALERSGVATPGPYLGLWGALTSAWALVFWLLRRRSGPVTFVERQLAHLWGSSIVACFLLLVIEMLLGLRVLTLAPMIAVVSAGVFVGKAALLSGAFYVQAGALYATALAMVLWPRWGMPVFGLVSGLCFFVPGWRARRRGRAG